MKYISYFPLLEKTTINKEMDALTNELNELLTQSENLGCKSVKGGDYNVYIKECIGKLRRRYGKGNPKVNELVGKLLDVGKRIDDSEKKWNDIFNDHASDIDEAFRSMVGDEMTLRKIDSSYFHHDETLEQSLGCYCIWTSPEYCNIYVEFAGRDYRKYSKSVDDFLSRLSKMGYAIEHDIINFYDDDFQFSRIKNTRDVKKDPFSYDYTRKPFKMSINVLIKL